MAASHGFDAASLSSLFMGVQPDSHILELAAPPAAIRIKNWKSYRSRFLDPVHVKSATDFWKRHAADLDRAEKEYGVPASCIVGILGVETLYGRYMGRFPVLQSLVNLAFDYPDAPNREARVALFRQQLTEFLLMCREQHQDPHDYSGSFTGAIGIPQFLPGSIRAFAVDFDGDGRLDLRGSEVDAIGSVARFLQMHGWERDKPVFWRVRMDTSSRKVLEAKADGDPLPKHRLGDLVDAGLKLEALSAVIAAEREAQVILVDLPTPKKPTEYRVGFRNFYALTRYNRSFFYAETVAELGLAAKALKEGNAKAIKTRRSRYSRTGG
jgi:membrane-bound lytic murein transglycosylase B